MASCQNPVLPEVRKLVCGDRYAVDHLRALFSYRIHQKINKNYSNRKITKKFLIRGIRKKTLQTGSNMQDNMIAKFQGFPICLT